MKKITLLLLSVFTSLAFAQGTTQDYKNAEKFHFENITNYVYTSYVGSNWTGDSHFWYRSRTRDGYKFIVYDVDKKSKSEIFDHKLLAEKIFTKRSIQTNYKNLPFTSIEFVDDMGSIQFSIGDTLWNYSLNEQKLSVAEKKKGREENLSPDEEYKIITENFNLFLVTKENDKKTQLTTDGITDYDYAYWPSWYRVDNESIKGKDTRTTSVTWSPDSKKFITFRLDRREVKKLFLLKSVPNNSMRAEAFSYERPLPGDTNLTYVEYYIFDIETKKKVRAEIPRFASFLSWSAPEWSEDGTKLYYFHTYRGHEKVQVLEIDAETGKSRIITEDKSDTYVDPRMFSMNFNKDKSEVFITSERNGWNHIYRYDWETGELINQVTKGEFVVRDILSINDDGTILFYGNGKEKNRDPYFRHLYKVNFDGSNLMLLTPEDAEHSIQFSKNNKYFIDNYSRIDLKPKSVLRSVETGKLIDVIEEADIKDLLVAGWKFPERIKIKARDNKTDIYGAIYRPSTFDENKKYPVIDGTYSGPHTIRTPKSFYRAHRSSDVALAELGFVIVNVDGFGSAFRSKKFHEFSYKNLGDIGAEDHITAMKQLAEKYPYMDLDRVGIYGHSAGGYDAAHALLIKPDFYKVAVSSAGNHDHRMAKAWWPELWMGYPVGKEYDEQSNLTLAENLKGKLLLVHGDMDNNVNPASTIKFADELIKANKNFDLLIMPNRTHSLYDHKYFIRKRWDYFVQHLLNVEPPKEFKLEINKTEF